MPMQWVAWISLKLGSHGLQTKDHLLIYENVTAAKYSEVNISIWYLNIGPIYRDPTPAKDGFLLKDQLAQPAPRSQSP